MNEPQSVSMPAESTAVTVAAASAVYLWLSCTSATAPQSDVT